MTDQTGRWLPFCAAQFRSYPVLVANQPLHDAAYAASGAMPNQTGSQCASLRSTPCRRPANPAARRAPRSQAMTRHANPTMYQAPFHLAAQAQPRQIPASTRSQRMPSRGPPGSPVPARAAAARAALVRSRSMTSSPKAASTQNMTKMSRIAVRLSTNSRPSRPSSRPATHPSSVERVILRVIRAVIKMASDPVRATANRQPNGVRPKSHSPAEIMILPSGGCATYSPPPAKMCVLPCTSS